MEFWRNEKNMEQVKKNLTLLGRLKWLGPVLAVVMYLFVEPRLGYMWALALGSIAGSAYILICDNARKTIMCEHVALDLGAVLKARGFSRHSFEIKSLKTGLIIRIYLISAGEKAVACNTIIMERITNSWYKDMVWITQLVDLDSEEDINEARDNLDDELIEQLKRMKEESRKK